MCLKRMNHFTMDIYTLEIFKDSCPRSVWSRLSRIWFALETELPQSVGDWVVSVKRIRLC